MGRTGKAKYISQKKSRKIDLCEEFFERNKTSATSISKRKFSIEKKIPESTFGGWLREIIFLKSDSNGNIVRTKSAEFPIIEKQVYKWFVEFKNAGNTCYFTQIVDQYRGFMNTYYPMNQKFEPDENDYLVYSDEYHVEIKTARVRRFLTRHNIKNRTTHGEIRDADWNAALSFRLRSTNSHFLDWEDSKFETIPKYNPDETGLPYRMDQCGKEMTRNGKKSDLQGKKIPKERFTVTVCISDQGHQLKPQIITKHETHRCCTAAGITTDTDWKTKVGVYKDFQGNAWQDRHTFKRYLLNIGQEIADYHGNIGEAIIIMDNARPHIKALELFDNPEVIEIGEFKIYISFLSPRITSLVQPCDMHIIVQPKRSYRAKLIAIRATNPNFKPNFYQAITVGFLILDRY